MNVRKYHIYLANLEPRFGTEPGKRRPVVVVQTDLLNGTHPSTIICPITTNIIEGASILRVHLSKKESSLKKDCDILVDQIRSIDNRRFISEIGQLSAVKRAHLLENMKIILLE